MLVPWKKSYNKPRQHIEKQRYHFADKGPYSQNYGFSSSHVCMWELDHKEGWVLKNWCFWIVVLEKTLESPLESKEIKRVNPKGNRLWIFTGRTDAKSEAPILWPPDLKSQFTRKGTWRWKRLEAGGEGDDRGWDGWMASLTQWTWVWENSESWWRTGKPGKLQSMGLQRVGHYWATEQQISLQEYTTICPFTSWWTFGSITAFGYSQKCYHETSVCKSLRECMLFYPLVKLA